MNNIVLDKENPSKAKTIKEFYKKLPNRISPKSDFLREICKRCGVTFMTARNWVVYGMKPSNKEHYKVLSELTGIPENHLFED